MQKTAFLFFPLLMMCAMLTDRKPFFDGPYVFYKNDQVYVKYISEENGNKTLQQDSSALSAKKDILLQVNTGVPGKVFTVKLKENLHDEPSDYSTPAKQLILSDIEGNFGAFTKLLQANGVVDTGYNWIFGNGHLVLIGDFVDRGEMVTEVHWLIYSLEEKAKAAGGYVHYILGNHEIMNMSGDLRYLNAKYKTSAALMNENFESVYGEQSELGRWLRTKNIMEKIGHNLFMHAGISNEMNEADISLKKINSLSRPFYADTTYTYPDERLHIIYGDNGPFWYRGYYKEDKTGMEDVVDKTLSLYNVKHIFTGHTIVSDVISVWYDGKIINTDLHHAGGKSEAVLIEGKNYFRVNTKGEKFPLKVSR
ncbi:MAG TPA: metallophosphoesterase [Chitinophagaceae bacterium]